MKVDDKITVPIPRCPDVICEYRKGCTYRIVKYTQSKTYNPKKKHYTYNRITIGHTCSATEMHPNDNYKTIFKGQYEKEAGYEVSATSKRFGLFSVCQAVNERIGIKDVLDSTIGENNANMIVDYAMFSILNHSNAAASFEDSMRDQMRFSSKSYSDASYDQLFKNGISKDEMDAFRKAWALQCKEDGVDSAWICIDGSNDECESFGVEIAEKGHNKTGQNGNIVSFTYAVAQEGRPVTYELYSGGLVDAAAIERIINFLNEYGIRICGVILFRGYCTSRALRYLRSHEIPYIIMIKGTPQGYEDLFLSDSETIRLNMDYQVGGSHLFGIQRKLQLFKDLDQEDYITLFYDFMNASGSLAALLANVNRERERIEADIEAGKTPSVSPKYEDLLEIVPAGKEEQSVPTIHCTEEMQKRVNEKGFYSVVSSEKMTPREIQTHYSACNVSETQYRFVKEQLGYGKVRVLNTSSTQTRFMTGFVASVIRFEFDQVAREMQCDTDQIIHEVNQYEMVKLNDAYTYAHIEKESVKKLFHKLGVELETVLDDSVKAENDREKGVSPALQHRKTGSKEDNHRKESDVKHSKPGPAKGYKHGPLNADGTPRKKPGVAKGTKRGDYNKDGSPRKKPGPKRDSSRKDQETA